MRNGGRWAAVSALALSVGLTGCGASTTTTSSSSEPPAQVEAISGKDVKQVTLTDQAVKRVGIETTTVAAATKDAAGAAPATPMMTLPYSAVIYSADGAAWVYTVPSPRTYIRDKVVVANVGGDQGSVAWLSAGPAVGTTVVTVGVPELYGAELGVGK
jgi:uncharacterized protein YceK